MFNPLDLSGRRVLVTGAGSGIGRATAVLVSRLSGSVAAVDRDAKGLAETVARLEGTGHTKRVCDLLDIASIPGWMADLAHEWGTLHGLVHAAGIPCVAPLQVLEPASYRDALTVNLEAGIALARSMQQRKIYAGEKGSLVFIASVMGLVGSPTVIGYSMSKAALIGGARSMALELAPKGIRVNCIAPGFVRTPMFEKVAKLWSGDQAERTKALHPLGWGEPEDIANAVAFLLGDTARWITGTVLPVDGGYTAR